MTKFNPEGKEKPTHGDVLGAAMEITDQKDADQYKRAYMDFIKKTANITEERALEIVNSNFGYYAGYYSDETRRRVEKLFNCSHPVFGSIAKNGAPTNEEAFNRGFNLGKK